MGIKRDLKELGYAVSQYEHKVADSYNKTENSTYFSSESSAHHLKVFVSLAGFIHTFLMAKTRHL